MKTRLRNPYQPALVTIGGLVGLALLTTLATWGLSLLGIVDPALTFIGFVFLLCFALFFFIIWLMGFGQVQRARAFLESDRPLIRWKYSSAQWQQMKDTIWQDEKGDWKVQWGCLTLIFMLTGLLTGGMLGLDGDFLDVIVNGGLGLLFGGLAGGTIGAFVAGCNYLGARQSRGRYDSGQVALGVNEIYASDDYFRGNGNSSRILEAEIQQGNPVTLRCLLLFPFRPRMPSEETWIIPVPPQWVDKVEEILPSLTLNMDD